MPAKGVILNEQSALVNAVAEVLRKDAKRERARAETNYQKNKGKRDLTLTEACRLVAEETASADTLSRYPNENPSRGRKYDVADSRYFSGDPYKQPTPEVSVQINNTADSRTLQKQLVDSAREIARIWSRIVDPRSRLSVSDKDACRAFLRSAFGALLSED